MHWKVTCQVAMSLQYSWLSSRHCVHVAHFKHVAHKRKLRASPRESTTTPWVTNKATNAVWIARESHKSYRVYKANPGNLPWSQRKVRISLSRPRYPLLSHTCADLQPRQPFSTLWQAKLPVEVLNPMHCMLSQSARLHHLLHRRSRWGAPRGC